jgi:hypothetical protein
MTWIPMQYRTSGDGIVWSRWKPLHSIDDLLPGAMGENEHRFRRRRSAPPAIEEGVGVNPTAALHFCHRYQMCHS